MSIPLDVVSLLGGMPTFEQARLSADRITRKRQETRYVICESGHFYVVCGEDIETFFSEDTNILYASEVR
jgi:hypothetical protein